MITIRVKITEYDKDSNTCKASLLNGDIITLDPFVGCAIRMTDGEYHDGVGYSLVGKTYLLYKYSVYPDYVVPHEDGMVEIRY